MKKYDTVSFHGESFKTQGASLEDLVVRPVFSINTSCTNLTKAAEAELKIGATYTACFNSFLPRLSAQGATEKVV